jgi:long-chain acyl-CoA synthetase
MTVYIPQGAAMEKIWLRNYLPEEGSNAFISDQYTSVCALLEEALQRNAREIAFQHLEATLSYAEIDRLSHIIAAYLQQDVGLQKGARVAIMMPNCLQYPVILFAALRAGFVVVDVNPLSTPHELSQQLNAAGCSVLFVLNSCAYTVQQALPNLSLKKVIVSELGDLLPAPHSWSVNHAMIHVDKLVPAWKLDHVSFTKVLKRGKYCRLSPVFLSGDDAALIQTREAQQEMLTHHTLIAAILRADAAFKTELGAASENIITEVSAQSGEALAINYLWFIHVGGTHGIIESSYSA